ncbi:MAG: hypothetical protein ACLQDY_23370 [Streptosporangiaceae bacterium]
MLHRIRGLTVAATLAVSLAAASALAAPAALAAASGPVPAARTGSFTSWRAAQRAARFRLRRPTDTAGLKRAEPILVEPCVASGELRKRIVVTSYGSFRRGLLAITQNNSGMPCGNFGEAKKLGTYRVLGAKATLWGYCGLPHAPSCHSRKVTFYLTFRKSGVYYEASSYNRWQRTLLRFGRSLRRVR